MGASKWVSLTFLLFITLLMAPGIASADSPNGSTIPYSSVIVDSAGTYWILVNGESYENWYPDGGSNIAELLYLNSTIYALSNNNAWYVNYGGFWYGTTDPTGGNGGGGAPSESASGTSIPPASQIVDHNGTVWSVSNGYSYQNGNPDGGNNISEMLYLNGTVYVNTAGYGWYLYSYGWQQTKNPNAASESASGTAIPPASQIVDANGTVWTLSNGYSYQNGVPDGGSNITQLSYQYGVVYANTNGYGTFIYSNGWILTGAPGGQNPSAPAESPAGTTIPPASQIVDHNGTIWTVSNGYSYQNGVPDGGSNITQMTYQYGSVYVNTTAYGTFVYSNGWLLTGGSASPPPSSPSPSPAVGGTALGGCGSCDENQAGINALESIVGRSVDYTLVWGWADTAADLMYAFTYLESEYPSGKLHYDVPMVISGHTFADDYNGSDDATYLNVAQTIAARDPNGYIRIGHEMNGSGYDWQAPGPAGSQAEFVLAFRHLVTLFRSVSTGFKFVWNPGAGNCCGYDSLPTYPGNQYTDVISFDIYEDAWIAQSYSGADRWNYMLDMQGRGLTWFGQFAAQQGKPVAFDEWASATDDGFFINNMCTWMQQNNVIYQMWWNSNDSFTSYLPNMPNNAAAFKQCFGN